MTDTICGPQCNVKFALRLLGSLDIDIQSSDFRGLSLLREINPI